MFEKLRMRRDRVNCTSKRNTADNETPASSDEPMTPVQAKNQMKELWAENRRTVSALKNLMEIARPLRKEESSKFSGIKLFKEYPAFGLKDIVSTLSKIKYTELHLSPTFI